MPVLADFTPITLLQNKGGSSFVSKKLTHLVFWLYKVLYENVRLKQNKQAAVKSKIALYPFILSTRLSL